MRSQRVASASPQSPDPMRLDVKDSPMSLSGILSWRRASRIKLLGASSLLSSNPKVMAAALVSGPHTKIYIRIVLITVDLDFLGSY